MSEENFNKVMDGMNFYRQEADKAVEGKAYFAACVMVGAGLEAMLKALCMAYKDPRNQDSQILGNSLD